MAVLENSKHEQFALLVAKGVSASKAYVSAGYSAAGAKVSASRLLTNANVCSRIRLLADSRAPRDPFGGHDRARNL
jgi:phage terminase small subunit